MQYEPLKAENEIRVLRFLDLPSPVSTKDTIQCSIKNVLLEDSPNFQSHQREPHNQTCPMVWDVFTRCVDLRESTLEQTTLDKATYLGLSQTHNQHSCSRYVWGDFEALSYTWGDQGDARRIYINGSCRDVPKNLEEALRALRGLKETRLGMHYWVDSLCIDQENEDERNEQVKRMKEIYSRARTTVVWLGQEEREDRTAIQTMRHLCRDPYVESPLRIPQDLLLDAWPARVAFMRKPYWNRSWIIQELAVNHNSTLILCGRFKLTRRMIRLGAIYCQEWLKASENQSDQSDPNSDPDAWSMASRVYRRASLTFNPNDGARLDLLLNLVRRADATDQKDKVYGILGLLDPAVSMDIVPNYSRSERQAYPDFMKPIVKKSRRLEQIMFGGIPTEEG